MRILILALTLGLASCINPYRPRVLLEGVEAHHVRRDIWRITVRGNDFPSTPPLIYYALVQTAQTTIAHGGTHFIVLSPTVAPSPFERGFGTVSMTQSDEMIIRIIVVGLGKRAPAGAFDAEQVLRFARARLSNG
jgi:hypothetical protein